MQKIVPSFWFEANAHEAVEYYVSVFPESRIDSIEYYPNGAEEGLGELQINMAGKVLVVDFSLNGQQFMAINAGPEFKFNEAVSFSVLCKDQQEIDYYWDKLSSDSSAEQCGWCKDKFGLSWQVVSENMRDLMRQPGAYSRMMSMKKIVIDDFLATDQA
jgi:predicted 3-demethylubiquinone-9 3-methyltransferase (glyoxalase superfamily)